MKGGVTALALAAGGLAWHLAARRAGPLLLPTPAAVAAALGRDADRLAEATLQTALAAGLGLVAALALGVGAAVAAWASDVLRRALLPYAVLLQVIPIVAIAPLLVVWLGYGRGVSTTTAVIAAFYPVYSAASTGLAAPAEELVDLLRLYGAPRWRELVDLRLVAALPALFSGVRSAAGLAVIGAIVGEFVGSNGVPPTLGQLVVYGARAARLDLSFAAVACAAGLALALHGAVRLAEARAVGRWYGA